MKKNIVLSISFIGVIVIAFFCWSFYENRHVAEVNQEPNVTETNNEEVVEDVIEEPIEEAVKDVIEEPVEEVVEDVAEEPVEDVVEEPLQEMVEETEKNQSENEELKGEQYEEVETKEEVNNSPVQTVPEQNSAPSNSQEVTNEQNNTVANPSQNENPQTNYETSVEFVDGGIVFIKNEVCEHNWVLHSEKIVDEYQTLDSIETGYKCTACGSNVSESFLVCPLCSAELAIEPYIIEHYITVPAQYFEFTYCSKCGQTQ